jgi:diguanylate cyclase (GGDEF)-like protein
MSETHDIEEFLPRTASETRSAIDRLIVLAEESIDTDPAQAVRLAEQAAAACRLPPFEKKPYQKGLARSYHAAASAYLNQGDFGQALKFHSDSLSVYQAIHDRGKIASQFNHIGTVYACCADYAEALKHLHAAEAYLDERTPITLKAEILNNIGFTHVTLGDYTQAIPILLSSLETTKRIPRPGRPESLIAQANIFDSLCQAYLAQNNLSAALQAGLNSTRLCRQVGDLKKEAEYLLTLGEVYSRIENLEQANACFQKTLTLSQEHGFRREECEAYRRLGIQQYRQENFTQAVPLLRNALAIAREIKIQREVYECYHAFAMLYKMTGEFEKALNHYESFHQIKESVFNDQSDQRIKNLAMLHRVEQARREAEIQHLKSVELQDEIEERKKAQELAGILASTDSLTGIYNRRHLFSLVERWIAESIQQQGPLSAPPLGVILIDIDHFKTINDRYGHQEGDRALAAIAHKISATLRNGDIVGRYGGEEFLVALPEANLDLAQVIGERLRTAVKNLEISPAYPDLKVTISLGVASIEAGAPQEDDNILEKLINHADQALNTARRQGRNRVAAYPAYSSSPDG